MTVGAHSMHVIQLRDESNIEVVNSVFKGEVPGDGAPSFGKGSALATDTSQLKVKKSTFTKL